MFVGICYSSVRTLFTYKKVVTYRNLNISICICIYIYIIVPSCVCVCVLYAKVLQVNG